MRDQLKITLYSTSDPIRAKIREAFKGAQYLLVEVTDSVKVTQKVGINEKAQAGTVGRLNLPLKVDAVITTAGLTRQVENMAARLALQQNRNDVFAVVLPEGMDYLRTKLDRERELVLVGSDQAK